MDTHKRDIWPQMDRQQQEDNEKGQWRRQTAEEQMKQTDTDKRRKEQWRRDSRRTRDGQRQNKTGTVEERQLGNT